MFVYLFLNVFASLFVCTFLCFSTLVFVHFVRISLFIVLDFFYVCTFACECLFECERKANFGFDSTAAAENTEQSELIFIYRRNIQRTSICRVN